MISKGLGHIPDVIKPSWEPVSNLVGAARPNRFPSSFYMLADAAHEPIDQGNLEACVGAAISQAIYTKQNVLGNKLPLPSWMFIWWMARKYVGTNSSNVGCSPSVAFDKVKKFGYCSESLWDHHNDYSITPDDYVFQQAIDQNNLKSYRCFSDEEQRENEIKLSISQFHPVLSAIQITDTYFETKGVWTGDGKPVGYHYVVNLAFDKDGLWHIGSYGKDWGDNGFCFVPWSVIRNPVKTLDVWTLTYV